MKHYIPVLLWATIIFVLSTMPGKYFPSFSLADLFSLDKVVHMIMYGVLMYLMASAYFKNEPSSSRHIVLWTMMALSSFYGASMEWIQDTFFPERMFEYLDMLANFIGAMAALGIAYFLKLGKLNHSA